MTFLQTYNYILKEAYDNLESDINSYLNEVTNTYYDEGNPLKLNISNVNVEIGLETLDDGDEALFIHDIYTDSEHQGKGYASKILNIILKWADTHDMPVALRASSEGHYGIKGLSQNELVRWYEKNGFVFAKDASVYGEDEIFMIRRK